MPFVKDQSGNPGGKSKESKEIRDLARLQAIETLAEIMVSAESDQARVAAANAILDRGLGKPPQAVEHTGEDGGPIQVTSGATTPPCSRRQRTASRDRSDGCTLVV